MEGGGLNYNFQIVIKEITGLYIMSVQYYLQKANILIRKAPSIIYPTPPLSLLIAPAVPPLNSVLGVWNREK